MNIDEIVKELSNEKSNHVAHRFPCRAVMVPTIEEYNYLLDRLAGICDITLSGDDLCFNDDTLPEYDTLADRLSTDYADKWVLLPGVSEYLRLFAKYEEMEGAHGPFYVLWHKMLDSQSKTRVIIPLIDCSPAWERLRLSDDLRMTDFVIKPDEIPDELPTIQVKVFSDNLADTVLTLENSSAAVLLNIRDWLNVWSDISNPVDPAQTDFILVTAMYRLVEPCNGTLTVRVIDSAYNFILETAADSDQLVREWVTEEALKALVPSVASGKTLKESLLTALNMHAFDTATLAEKWNHLTFSEKQLAVVLLRLSDEKSYFQHCAMKAKDANQVASLLLKEIFATKLGHPEWIQESVAINKIIQTPKDAEWFQLLDAIPSWEERLMYLSASSLEERKYIIKLAGKVIKQYGVSSTELAKKMQSVYPVFASYLSKNNTGADDKLTSYIETYKRNKVSNIFPSDHQTILEHIHVDGYPYRYQVLSDNIRESEDAFVLWVDGLGIEWQACLIDLLHNVLSDVTFAADTSVQATLPSETEFNNQWESMEIDHHKLDGLDKLAHHGHIDDKSYEACIADQLQFIQSIVSTVQELLKLHQTVIITGDHGTSRAAALAFHMPELAIVAPTHAEVMCHGRFCLVRDDKTPHSDSERTCTTNGKSYLVMQTYHHYVASGNAAGHNDEETSTYGELHGGATPEEMLVPVIVITNNKPIVPLSVKFESKDITKKGNGAVINVEFSRPVSTMSASIDKMAAVCSKTTDSIHWQIKIADAVKGTWPISITADMCSMRDLPKITISPAGFSEDDFFGDM